MTTIIEGVSRLVRELCIKPASCRHTALVLAGAQSDEHGVFAATMADMAAWTGLSKNQVRKHVHSLVSMGVLRVVANAHGGSPMNAPQYQFVASRLRDLAQHAGSTPDLFDFAPRNAPTYRFRSHAGAQMVAQLIGKPGRRQVQFYRESPQGLRDYGQVPLATVLRPWRVEGGWEAAVFPVIEHDDDNYQEEIHPGEYENLQQWAQTAALGRTESVVVA